MEDVVLRRRGDVQPGAGQQAAHGAAPREVRAPPDVQPAPQNLRDTQTERRVHASAFLCHWGPGRPVGSLEMNRTCKMR